MKCRWKMNDTTYVDVEPWWKQTIRGKTEVLGEKPVPNQHLPPQITNGLGCDRIRPSRLQPAIETLYGHNICSVYSLIPTQIAAFLEVKPCTSIKIKSFKHFGGSAFTLCTPMMRQNINSKSWLLRTNLHGVTSQNTRKLTLAAFQTSLL